MTCIIILNWNGIEVTIECINSLLLIESVPFRIIIVDNGSHDNSVPILKQQFGQNSLITIIELKKNLGFTGGNNLGIDYAKKNFDPQYYLLLNNDTVVENTFLKKMISVIEEDKDIYAVVPKIFYFDNPDRLWFAGGNISKITGIVRHIGANHKDEKCFNVKKQTQFMNGCCALISDHAIKEIGNLDERFFANSEDVDYSLRITKAHKKIFYCPSAVIYHKVNYSFKSNKGKWFAFYLATRNIILLQKKHLHKSMLPFFYIIFCFRWIGYLTIKLSLYGDFKSVKALYKGTIDGVFNRLSYI